MNQLCQPVNLDVRFPLNLAAKKKLRLNYDSKRREEGTRGQKKSSQVQRKPEQPPGVAAELANPDPTASESWRRRERDIAVERISVEKKRREVTGHPPHRRVAHARQHEELLYILREGGAIASFPSDGPRKK